MEIYTSWEANVMPEEENNRKSYVAYDPEGRVSVVDEQTEDGVVSSILVDDVLVLKIANGIDLTLEPQGEEWYGESASVCPHCLDVGNHVWRVGDHKILPCRTCESVHDFLTEWKKETAENIESLGIGESITILSPYTTEHIEYWHPRTSYRANVRHYANTYTIDLHNGAKFEYLSETKDSAQECIQLLFENLIFTR